MKAQLLSNGDLIIHADNDLEAFALTQWESRRQGKRGGARLIIDANSERKTWEAMQDLSKVFQTAGASAKVFIENQGEIMRWIEANKDKTTAPAPTPEPR